MLLALASGAALIAIAGFSLWNGSRDAQQRAIWTAERDARDAARALRAALAQPAVLAHCPADQRFEIVAGSPQLDDDVAWLIAEGAAPDVLFDERLRQARLAEFADGDPAAAAAHFDELLDELSDEPKNDTRRTTVLLQAAWQSQRAGRDARTAVLHAEALGLLGDVRPGDLRSTAMAEALASSLLLAAHRTGKAEAAALELFAHAPRTIVEPTLQRLGERCGVDAAPMVAAARARHRRLAERRAVLRDAAAFVHDAAWRGSPQALEGRLVLWFPDRPGDASAGHGAILPAKWLRTLPGHEDPALLPVPERGQIVFGAPADDRTAEPVLDGFAWIEPTPPPPPPWFVRPTALLALGGALLLLFAGSAWATLRGLTRANAAMRARAEFLTGVTHELKTPIASMRLIADVLHDDGAELSAEQQQRYLAMLTGESARLTTLIDNVLDLGQIERGERAYDLRPDCCADAVRATVRGYEALAAHHGLHLSLREGVAHADAVLDRGAIEQALRNLLENARKYAAAGQRVEVTTERRGDRFVARVRDHGPGVPAAERDVIFTRFVRGRAQQDGSVPGVGLGLFLSREIARRHGGELSCIAVEGGAAFELSLPLTPDPPQEPTA